MLHRPGQSHENVTVEERLVAWTRRRVVMQARPFHARTVALRGRVVERQLDPLGLGCCRRVGNIEEDRHAHRFGVTARRTDRSIAAAKLAIDSTRSKPRGAGPPTLPRQQQPAEYQWKEGT